MEIVSAMEQEHAVLRLALQNQFALKNQCEDEEHIISIR